MLQNKKRKRLTAVSAESLHNIFPWDINKFRTGKIPRIT